MGSETLKAVAAAVFLILTPAAQADELRYHPINPNFGGSPFNGAYLLNNAQEQRQFDAPEKKRPTALEEFQDTVSRSLMSQISRQIADQILGEEAKDSGTFSVGDTTVNFHREGGQVVIDMMDAVSGGQTQITLPVPTY
jgi:curli production assembly/transport component CsgF